MNVQPDKNLLIEVATLKGMKESFVEKDWFVTQVIRTVSRINFGGFDIVFSGGTALSKAHNLLNRFSEDVDFRVMVTPEFRTRKKRSSFKHAVLDVLRADGFVIEDEHVKARDENRFFAVDLQYTSVFPRNNALRPHIQIEMAERNIQLPSVALPVSSFIAELARQEPEVSLIPCINPVESAADKLSAVAWRIPDRIRGSDDDDPSIVRHIHDLAILKERALAHEGFSVLVANAMQDDSDRAKNDPSLNNLSISGKIGKALDILATDDAYPEEYRRFVRDVSYAKSGHVPDFAEAVAAVHLLAEALSD